MDLQDQMLIQYFKYLRETEKDKEERERKILEAVRDYYAGLDFKEKH